jgi:hypothetical protein
MKVVMFEMGLTRGTGFCQIGMGVKTFQAQLK